MPAICPVVPGLEGCVRLHPARELGGDLYDFLACGKDRHLFAVGDVTGKGAPAALFGAMASGILRSLAPQRLPVAELMKRLNVTLLERKIEGHFVTLTCALWEPKARTIRLSNAGMPLPILLRNGRPQQIRAEGVPLGLLENTAYDEIALALEPGNLLAIFSDGLVEAANPQHEEFGTPRLEKLLREGARRPLAEIIETVFSEVARFEEGRARRDDQTLLVIRAR
jgi:sigma-B regulation protein RsbU (phosphoserine phosphatase)